MAPSDGNVPQDAHPKIWSLVRYWQSIHPTSRLPGRSHFDPLDIPKLLPNIRLLDVVDDRPFRYRVRLIGTEHTRHLGYDPTGTWYDMITDQFHNSVVERDLEQVCNLRQPVYRKGLTIVPYASGAKGIERVHVPFAGHGHVVDLIMSLTLFYPEKRPFAGPTLADILDSPGTAKIVPFPTRREGIGPAAPSA